MAINKKLTALIIFLSYQLSYSQSPFNYGQTNKVYFISTELRSELNIGTICTVSQFPGNETGGMGENWDVSMITFTPDMISDDWAPISKPKTYKYSFSNITTNLDFLNGSSYELAAGQLSAYGGNGYGSFSRNDITQLSDTVSIIATTYTGHSTNESTDYTKNVFNKQGLLKYVVSFVPPHIENNSEHEETEGEAPEKATVEDYDRFFNSLIENKHYSSDTLFYKYDNKGHLSGNYKTQNKPQINQLFTENTDPSSWQFYQCYIGNTRMEKYLLEKIGYTPELLLIEIYRYGVFSFKLNKNNGKYYRGQTKILEQQSQ